MRFHSTVELGGKTATGVEVPADIVSALGSSKRPAVNVTINEYTYRTTVASMGGRFMIPLSADNRAGAGVAAGDEVDVDMQLDTEPRTVEVPSDLASALDRHPPARRSFDALSYSNQRRHVLAVDGAKAAATRQRRIDKIVDELSSQG